MDSQSESSYNRPPVITPGPLSRPRSKGRGWMIVAIILVVILFFSVMANLQLFLGGFLKVPGTIAYSAGPRLDEFLVEDNDADDKIAIVDVEGIISSQPLGADGVTMVKLIRAQLERAAKDHHVRAVLLRVNSPGGEVLASDEINHEIARFQKETGKPVVATMQGLAASGGYYVSAPCLWIVANELTITGSIGVIMSSWNYRGLMDKVGVSPNVYKSGRFKDMLSGSRRPEDIPPEERAMIQKLIDDTFLKFKEVVAEGRGRADSANGSKGRKLADDWEDYADGRILSGEQAYELGFVDELGTFDVAVERAKTLAGIRKANLVKFQQRFTLSNFLGLLGKSESKVIKLDIGIDAPELKVGQPYFLSPSYLQ